MFVIALLAILVLPSFVRTTAMEARAGSNDEAPARRRRQAGYSDDFRISVRRPIRARRDPFLNGDKITIPEVRGTADTFAPGNIYWIKGTYTLASHDRAMLAAYTTAMDAENGRGSHI